VPFKRWSVHKSQLLSPLLQLVSQAGVGGGLLKRKRFKGLLILLLLLLLLLLFLCLALKKASLVVVRTLGWPMLRLP
jgi:hypothetical protein